jgi:hypothetical protein
VLPAYDNFGGPPKYVDIELNTLGASRVVGGPIGPGVGAGMGTRRAGVELGGWEARRYLGAFGRRAEASPPLPVAAAVPLRPIGAPPPFWTTTTTAESGTGATTLTMTSSPTVETSTSDPSTTLPLLAAGPTASVNSTRTSS